MSNVYTNDFCDFCDTLQPILHGMGDQACGGDVMIRCETCERKARGLIRFRFTVMIVQHDPYEVWFQHYEHDLANWNVAIVRAETQVAELNQAEQQNSNNPIVYTLSRVSVVDGWVDEGNLPNGFIALN